MLLTQDQGLRIWDCGISTATCATLLCWVAGQILRALDSGQYDAHSCGVLIGQAGDECRGSCFIRILRRVLDRAGYPEVALVSLNVRGIDRQDALPLNPGMIGKALAAAVWGDTLAIARDQLRPLEARSRLCAGPLAAVGGHLGSGFGPHSLPPEILGPVPGDHRVFRAVETAERPVQDVAVVGEIYTKNAAGNGICGTTACPTAAGST